MISKQANAPYRAGRQSSWMKVKCGRRQEFIIIGYSLARSGGRALGALYLAYRQKGELRYAGKVGTGFSMQSARALTARFAKVASDKPVLTREQTAGMGAGEWRRVRWVKPELLCEVAFTEWTADGRIRHPSFQGLRDDKKAEQVVRETPQRAAAQPEAPMINITHRDRVISETGHVTKGEVADYYAAAAPRILASIARHPLSLLRCPTGIDGACFFQRSPGKGFGEHIRPFKFKHKGNVYNYFYIEDEAGLLELIQMGTIEIHPWGASVDAIDCPDRMIFDLDPAPDVPFSALKLAALDLRQRLRKRHLDATLKCTGGKGLHLTVPLGARERWPEVKAFAASIAGEMVASAPNAYVATMAKAKRTGKVFIDFFRNDYTATAVADYSVRARPGAPVAMPIDWSELKRLESPSQFTIKDAMRRLQRKPPAAAPAAQRLAA
jgi:bifunctional non-homologous end joining protein LigD